MKFGDIKVTKTAEISSASTAGQHIHYLSSIIIHSPHEIVGT